MNRRAFLATTAAAAAAVTAANAATVAPLGQTGVYTSVQGALKP